MGGSLDDRYENKLRICLSQMTVLDVFAVSTSSDGLHEHLVVILDGPILEFYGEPHSPVQRFVTGERFYARLDQLSTITEMEAIGRAAML